MSDCDIARAKLNTPKTLICVSFVMQQSLVRIGFISELAGVSAATAWRILENHDPTRDYGAHRYFAPEEVPVVVALVGVTINMLKQVEGGRQG